MKTKRFADLAARDRSDPVQAERIEAHKRAIEDALRLAEIRERRGVTQRGLAATLGVSQANVSRIEHKEDVYLSTLRRYVEALGGRLEVTAVFPDDQVTLVARSS